MNESAIKVSRQWASRPNDERFTSLIDLRDHFDVIRQQSRGAVVSTSDLRVEPTDDNQGLLLVGPRGHGYEPTNWAFGQLAINAEAPAGYLRTLPAPVAADCLNYGLRFKRNVEDVGVLLQSNGHNVLRAVTGPRYGRIWNSEVVGALVDRFGDGLSGDWRVPGEFGRDVEITKKNTTLFASDRDVFVFLADERNRVEIPNRRDGKSGSLARGFYVWNSEVGAATFGFGTFLFDYTCSNRIVWGQREYKELKIRHTASAPDRFFREIQPALEDFASSTAHSIENTLKRAQARKIDDVNEFLASRFGKRSVQALQAIHQLEENRPIETIWDAVTSVTAQARSIPFQDARVDLETKAGDLLTLA